MHAMGQAIYRHGDMQIVRGADVHYIRFFLIQHFLQAGISPSSIFSDKVLRSFLFNIRKASQLAFSQLAETCGMDGGNAAASDYD